MNKKYAIDLAERVAATAVFTFASVVELSDLSSVKSAGIAAGAAALSLVKGALAKYLGSDGAGLTK